MAGLAPWFKPNFSTLIGAPAGGYKLHTYIAGTTTNFDTYKNIGETSTHDNPIILDNRGDIPGEWWLSTQVAYKMSLEDENGAEVWFQDNVTVLASGEVSGLTQVAHTDSTTISLEGLGTLTMPLSASVLISSISANALGITTGGLYVADLSDAIADKLDKVQAGAQSVVSEVELKQGLDITGVNPDSSAIRVPDNSWIMPQTAQQALYLTNGVDPSTSNSVLQLTDGYTELTAGDGNDSLGSLIIFDDRVILKRNIAGVGQDSLTLENETLKLQSKSGRGFYLTSTNAEMSNTTSNISMGTNGIRLNGLSGQYGFVNVPDGTPTKFYGQDGSGDMVKGDPVSPNEEVFINQISTGVNYGLSIGNTVLFGTEVTIDLGQGFVLDREDPDALTPKLYKPTFASSFTYEIVDTISPSMFLYMDKTGAIQEFSSQDDERKHDGLISLGALGVFGGVIVQVVPLPNLSFSPMTHMLDLSAGIGLIRTGAMISTVMSTLNLAQGEGSLTLLGANFYNNPKNPNRIPLSATSPLYWVPATPTELQNAPVNTINVDQYLVSGVLTTIPNNAKWSILTMYIGANGFPFLFQGQEVTYGTKNEALDALALGTYTFTNHPLFANKPNNAIHAGDLIVEKGMTNLDNAFWKEDNRFGLAGGGGVGSAGAFLDKATVDPQNVAGAVTWAGIQTFDSAINGTSLGMSGAGTFGGLITANSQLIVGGTESSSINATIRYTEGSTFQGAFARYDGNTNKFEMGVHNAVDSNLGSDSVVISIDRSTDILSLSSRLLQGPVTDTGEGIICESLKAEGSGTFEGTLGSVVVGESPVNTDKTGNSIKFTRNGVSYINYLSGGASGALSLGDGTSHSLFLFSDLSAKFFNGLTVDGGVSNKLYTTTEKNALSVPEGTQVYDSTLKKMCFYNGSAWETITSS
jgi:hypothetical protein